MELLRTGRAYPTLHPVRIDIAQNLWRVMTEDVQQLGSVGFTGSVYGLPMKRNNMRNIPDKCVFCRYGGITANWAFEGGIGGILKKCVNSQAVYPLSEQHGLKARERRYTAHEEGKHWE